jgi:hypothetical protein
MPRPASTPTGAVRTFVFAIASGLLLFALALEVAVATLEHRQPAYVPGSCVDDRTHDTLGPPEPCGP